MSTDLLVCGKPLGLRSPERDLERREREGDLERRERFSSAYPSRLGDTARAEERRGEAERRERRSDERERERERTLSFLLSVTRRSRRSDERERERSFSLRLSTTKRASDEPLEPLSFERPSLGSTWSRSEARFTGFFPLLAEPFPETAFLAR